MSKVSVFDQGWIDLVFEGRNKSYGAYQLRRQDPRTTMIALFSGIALIATLVAIPSVINYFTPAIEIVSATDDGPIVITDLSPITTPPKKPEPVLPQKPAGAQASSAKQVKWSTPVVTSAPTDIALTNDDLKHANPSDHNDPGDNGNNIPIGSNGSSTGKTPDGTGKDPVVDTNAPVNVGNLKITPQFPGGIQKFYEMVGDRFRTPETDAKTTTKVYVYFVVERDGTMSNIKVVNKPGEAVEREAIRVLKSIRSKWTPGEQNGEKVRTAFTLPITVNVN